MARKFKKSTQETAIMRALSEFVTGFEGSRREQEKVNRAVAEATLEKERKEREFALEAAKAALPQYGEGTVINEQGKVVGSGRFLKKESLDPTLLKGLVDPKYQGLFPGLPGNQSSPSADDNQTFGAAAMKAKLAQEAAAAAVAKEERERQARVDLEQMQIEARAKQNKIDSLEKKLADQEEFNSTVLRTKASVAKEAQIRNELAALKAVGSSPAVVRPNPNKVQQALTEAVPEPFRGALPELITGKPTVVSSKTDADYMMEAVRTLSKAEKLINEETLKEAVRRLKLEDAKQK